MTRKPTYQENQTRKRKQRNKEANYPIVKDIYDSGKDLIPAEYLMCHQDAGEETKTKVVAAAQARRERRNQRRMEVTK